jgi:glucose/arabinose dehydrogenase
MRTLIILLLVNIGLAFGLMSWACVKRSNESQPQSGTTKSPDKAAMSSEETQKATLGHYEIKPSDLPPPFETRDVENPPHIIPRPSGAGLQLPPGFVATVFAEGGFLQPRWLAQAPNDDVFVADSKAGNIIVLRDTDGDGTADQRFTFASVLNQPFGMAFWRDYLYVGNTDAVIRFRYRPGQIKAEGDPEKIADLPGRGYREHWTRNLLFNPSGSKLYVTVGSQSNVDVEQYPRASILEFEPDGTRRRVFASGLRNPVGLSFYPGTNQLWATVQERDRLGDDLPPDFVTSINEGGFYGWPYTYIGSNPDPRHQGDWLDLHTQAIVPDLLVQAHSGILGLTFYTGSMFPQAYRGDAFVAMHGSWNRSKRTGYKVVRIHFQNNRPVGGYDDFVVGWMLSEDKPEVWGRPSGLLVMKDGSMLIADDGANKIWRITYHEPTP